ncbi:hypothetical protein QE152_g1923 [Popillia japonica]|uniref:Uncharacterized protein n=1 Tax=Popillia japonica TaxID=7064 RepID=A0AAW1N4U5_POPJA
MLSAFAVYNSNADIKNSFKKKKLQQNSVTIKKKRYPKRGENSMNDVKNQSSSKNYVKINTSPYNGHLKKSSIKPKLNALKQKEKIQEMTHYSPPPVLQEPVKKKLKRSKVKTKRKLVKIVEIDREVFNKPLDLLKYLLAPIDTSEFH